MRSVHSAGMNDRITNPAVTSAAPIAILLRLFHQRKIAIAAIATSAPREWLPIAANAVSTMNPVIASFCQRFLRLIWT